MLRNAVRVGCQISRKKNKTKVNGSEGMGYDVRLYEIDKEDLKLTFRKLAVRSLAVASQPRQL